MSPITTSRNKCSNTVLQSDTTKVNNDALNRTSLICESAELDGDCAATMTVCRACLAMGVKMFNMPEHKLSIMYAQVTGVQINAEDKLPQMLCWECLARLLSAKRFTEKALKAQWVLSNQINSSKFITINDIKSIDIHRNELKSSLGSNFFKVNESNVHIIEETNDTYNHETINEMEFDYLTKNQKKQKELVQSIEKHQTDKQKVVKKRRIPSKIFKSDVKESAAINKPEKFCENEVVYKIEECLIKSEEIDIPEEQVGDEVTEDIFASEDVKREYTDVANDGFVINIKEEDSDSVNEMSQVESRIDLSSKVCEVTLVPRIDGNRPTTLRNQSVITRPYKKLRELLESKSSYDTMDGSYVIALTKYNETVRQQTGKNEILLEERKHLKEPKYENDTEITSQTISTATHDISLKPVDPDKVFCICDYCKTTFNDKFILTKHILKHLKVYRCSYCDYKTGRKVNVNRHINSRHTKNLAYSCSHCSFKTHRKTNLNVHINAKHTKIISYNCDYCVYKTYHKAYLKRHINAKHTKKISYACTYCSFSTYQKGNLSVHINGKHTKQITFDCTYCDFITYQKANLTAHINAKHTKKVYFNCFLCEYKTYHNSNLTSHINAKHTQIISFSCSFCSFKAFKKAHLNRHINAKHTEQSSYDCSYCSFKTFREASLSEHVNAKHTKKVSYDCSLCGYRTYLKCNLRRHNTVKHHRNKSTGSDSG